MTEHTIHAGQTWQERASGRQFDVTQVTELPNEEVWVGYQARETGVPRTLVLAEWLSRMTLIKQA